MAFKEKFTVAAATFPPSSNSKHSQRTCWFITMLTMLSLLSYSLFWLLVSHISPGVAKPLIIPGKISNDPNDHPKALHNNISRLSLSPTGTFTLAIFSDLHYGENENSFGIQQDISSAAVMRSVLSTEKTLGLVVLNGDLITGENTFKENASSYVAVVVKPLVEADMPWASTYGNHDSKFNLSREDVFAQELMYPLSLTQRMTDPKTVPGITNYYLPLYETTGNKPAAILWFFDSRGGASYQHEPANEDDIPDWVANETVAWYRDTRAALVEEFGKLPSIAFVHIPPHPYLLAQDTKLDPRHFPGVNEDVPVAIEGEGHDDDTFVKALKEDEMLHSVYVGHDHGNAWCALWTSDVASSRRKLPDAQQSMHAERHGDDEESNEQVTQSKGGPFLCFSKHTGYGGYGNWNRGSRIVQLTFGDDRMGVDTWVRMENGSVVTAVTLNSTYGHDVYPTEDGGVAPS